MDKRIHGVDYVGSIQVYSTGEVSEEVGEGEEVKGSPTTFNIDDDFGTIVQVVQTKGVDVDRPRNTDPTFTVLTVSINDTGEDNVSGIGTEALLENTRMV